MSTTAPDTIDTNDTNNTTDTTIYILLRLPALYVSGSDSPTPPKPWYQVFDKHPKGWPPYNIEDPSNQSYASITTTLFDREQWLVKLEYKRNGRETLSIIDWYDSAAEAGMSLKQEVEKIARRFEGDMTVRLHIKFTADSEKNIKSCEYNLPARGEQEQTWYWWDVLPVKLEATKQYNLTDAEVDPHRAEYMEWRSKEGLDMARRTRGEFTEQELEEMAEAKERLGVVEGEDLEDNGIMGVE